MDKLKGVIVTNAYYSTDNTSLQAERMRAELEKLDVDVTVIKNSGAFCSVSDDYETEFSFDFAVYFDKDILVARAMKKAGVRVFNQPEAIEACDDKMVTFMSLDKENISFPTTVSGSFSYREVEELDETYLNEVEKIIGSYPMVVKKNSSSLGAGVYLAQTREALREKLKELSGERYLVQEFVRESAGKDIRIIVVGGKAVASMKRESSSDFRSNAELGGNCRPIIAGKRFIETAELVAKALGLDYCGVDLLIKEGEPVLCEVNSNAFFGAIERVTGVNVAKLYAEHIVSSMGIND